MRIGSLCTGYGGLDMAVAEVLGATTAWVSDIDKGACKILAHHYPGVPNIGDFTKADWSTVEPVDILTAGFPCQPVSNAGKQLGDQDERWLWDDVARAVGELGPRLIVLENVRGLLTAGAGRLFGRVLGTLADLGYDARWHGLRAAGVGAPHGRWRVFIAAYSHAAGRREQRWPVAARAEHPASEHRGSVPLTLLPTPAAHEPGGTAERYHERLHAHDGRKSAFLPLSMAVQLFPTPRSTRGGSTTEMAYALGGERTDRDRPQGEVVVELAAWGQYATAIQRWESLTRPAPPPTELGPKGSPRLSPRFSEWMMGLPAGWITDVPGITRNEALKAAGNGVVPQQAAAALRIMLGANVVAA